MCLALAEQNMSLPEYDIFNDNRVHCLALSPTENCFLTNPNSKAREFRRVGLATWSLKSWNILVGSQKGSAITVDLV
jgi:hypothetical protein